MSSAFRLKKNSNFKRTVTVVFPDDTKGSLEVTYAQKETDVVNDLLGKHGDLGLCREVVVAVPDVEIEGSADLLKGDEARAAVFADPCCVGAMAREYIEVMRTRNFRGN